MLEKKQLFTFNVWFSPIPSKIIKEEKVTDRLKKEVLFKNKSEFKE